MIYLTTRDPASVFLDNQVKTCGGCHEEYLGTYLKSVHGEGMSKLGLLVTALVGGYLLLLVKRTDQVEQLVGSRTQELRRAHDRLLGEVQEILAYPAQDLYVVRTPQGLKTVHEEIERMLGEKIGRLLRLRLLTARCIVESAQKRTESIGVHFITQGENV